MATAPSYTPPSGAGKTIGTTSSYDPRITDEGYQTPDWLANQAGTTTTTGANTTAPNAVYNPAPIPEYVYLDPRESDGFQPNTNDPTGPTQTTPVVNTTSYAAPENIVGEMQLRAQTGALPAGGVQVAESTPITANQNVSTTGTKLTTGKDVVSAGDDVNTRLSSYISAPDTPETYTADATQAGVTQAMDGTQAITGTVRPEAQVQAATMAPRSTAVAGVDAATLDQAQRVQAPTPMTVGEGEMVSGAVDMAAANALAAQTEASAATGMVSEQGTVQGQMANLMADFDAGAPPAWAAGAMRSATAAMAARGLSASSMAGQAIIQAAMESAMPIAQADAQTIASFEAQNLSNRQQSAMLAAQQRAQFMGQDFDQKFQAKVQNASRIADIANQNFSAEVQIALENSRMAQSVDLANLSNKQAVQMAEIAQIANLEMANLSNMQQAAVQNAQSFLQMDMANMSNQQQTELFKSQSIVQSILTDAASQNAAKQFNASSQNQVDQFNASLKTQVSQFNATQTNAMEQFNRTNEIDIAKYNAEVNNQREQFNAQNQLIINQSNAQWRRQVATADTAALNAANQANAQSVLAISTQAYNNLWNTMNDQMEYAWKAGENALDRAATLTGQEMTAKATITAAELAADRQASATIGEGIFSWLSDGGVSGALDDVGDAWDTVKGWFS